MEIQCWENMMQKTTTSNKEVGVNDEQFRQRTLAVMLIVAKTT